jgi:ribonuclease D
MSLITTTESLAEICQRLAQHPFVTVDTEFLRETTFWPKVCVIQLASDDEAVAVDTLAEGLDLTPFFDLMANPNVVKVFHAARQDLEIVWHLAKMIPAPLFDTQVAAMVCGYGDQVSYGELVQSVCKIPVDKSSRFTDWSRRPLTEAQVTYALADVTHLRDVYRALRARLDKSGRTGWLRAAVLGANDGIITTASLIIGVAAAGTIVLQEPGLRQVLPSAAANAPRSRGCADVRERGRPDGWLAEVTAPWSSDISRWGR